MGTHANINTNCVRVVQMSGLIFKDRSKLAKYCVLFSMVTVLAHFIAAYFYTCA